MAPQSNITLYTDSTPNGIKISMVLEELRLPYKTVHIDISKNTQKEPWFLEINPNGRIPAITDTFDDGELIRVFEGGSILQYLVERYDKEGEVLGFKKGSREEVEGRNWLFFQHGGIGPMQGQSAHFSRYAPQQIPYAIDRYRNETRRLYRVLDTHLGKSKSGFLVGDHLSIADIANFSWVLYGEYTNIDMTEFPKLKEWVERLKNKEGIDKGMDVPKRLWLKDAKPEDAEKYAQKAREWILKGMESDKK